MGQAISVSLDMVEIRVTNDSRGNTKVHSNQLLGFKAPSNT